MNANALDTGTPEDRQAARELLLAELQVFEEAIRRSEDTGDQRFNFFITLVTAVIGGLIALTTQMTAEQLASSFPKIAFGGTAALLAFGILTFMRMVHRDRVTAQLKRTVHHVRVTYRGLFLNSVLGLQDLKLPLKLSAAWQTPKSALEAAKPDKPWQKWRFAKGVKKFFRGGYSVTIAFINGGLLYAAIVACETRGEQPDLHSRVAEIWGMALAVVLTIFACIPFRDHVRDPARDVEI